MNNDSKAALCNAINNAVAAGKIVMTASTRLSGAYIQQSSSGLLLYCVELGFDSFGEPPLSERSFRFFEQTPIITFYMREGATVEILHAGETASADNAVSHENTAPVVKTNVSCHSQQESDKSINEKSDVAESLAAHVSADYNTYNLCLGSSAAPCMKCDEQNRAECVNGTLCDALWHRRERAPAFDYLRDVFEKASAEIIEKKFATEKMRIIDQIVKQIDFIIHADSRIALANTHSRSSFTERQDEGNAR